MSDTRMESEAFWKVYHKSWIQNPEFGVLRPKIVRLNSDVFGNEKSRTPNFFQSWIIEQIGNNQTESLDSVWFCFSPVTLLLYRDCTLNKLQQKVFLRQFTQQVSLTQPTKKSRKIEVGKIVNLLIMTQLDFLETTTLKFES